MNDARLFLFLPKDPINDVSGIRGFFRGFWSDVRVFLFRHDNTSTSCAITLSHVLSGTWDDDVSTNTRWTNQACTFVRGILRDRT